MSIEKELAKAQATWGASKEAQQQFGVELPVAVYDGQVQTFGLTKSNAGNLQMKMELVVTEGEYKGAVARAYRGLHTEMNLAIIRSQIEQLGYQCPENIQDLPATMQAIEADGALVRFKFSEREGFRNIRILEVYGAGAQPVDDGEPAVGDVVEVQAVPEESAPAEEDEQLAAARVFAIAQGIDVAEDADLDTIKASIAEYTYPVAGVCTEQLKDAGFEDTASVVPLSDEDVELLNSLGLTEALLLPDPSYNKPAPAPKAPKNAAKKAAAPTTPPAKKAAPPAAPAKGGAVRKR